MIRLPEDFIDFEDFIEDPDPDELPDPAGTTAPCRRDREIDHGGRSAAADATTATARVALPGREDAAEGICPAATAREPVPEGTIPW